MPRKTRVKRAISQDVKRATSAEEAKEVLEEITQELESKVVEEAEMKVTGRKPGVTVGGTKTTYTYRDLCEMFPIVKFTPEETIPLTFQGVRVQALANIEMHVPECFEKIYRQHRKTLSTAGRTLPQLGYENVVELGIGALPPENK